MWTRLWDSRRLLSLGVQHPRQRCLRGRGSFRKAVLLASAILAFQKQQLFRLQTPVRRYCRNPAAQNRLLQTLGNTEELPPHCEYSLASHQLFLNVEMRVLLPLCLRIAISLCLNYFGACRKEILYRSFNFFKTHQCFSLNPYLQCFSVIN